MTASLTPMTDALLASHRKENEDGGCDVKRAVRQVEELITHAKNLEIYLAAKTAECERLRESQREIAAALGVPGCDAAEMLNVIDSIREDAGRYRWLRCSPGGTMRDWLYMPHTEELDAAIDAARKETL